MIQQWPPSPCVEDEEAALAKEHVPGLPLHELKSEDQPASSRGSVDQYPIIIDTQTPDINSKNGLGLDEEHDQTPENVLLAGNEKSTPLPPVTNHEQRFVYLPSQDSETEQTDRAEPLPRPSSATQAAENDIRRGRPSVPRLQTDLGPGLGGKLTDNRRPPSPYAHKPATATNTLFAEPKNGYRLSPPSEAHNYRRPVSAQPGSYYARHNDSDSDHRSKSKRRPERNRSRSRSKRQSFSQSDRSDSDMFRPLTRPTRHHNRESDVGRNVHRHRSPAPLQGGLAGYIYTTQDGITPPQTPKLVSARSSVADHSTLSDSSNGRHGSKRVTTDSPNTSSAEEAQYRLLGSGDERRMTRRGRSRRGSRTHADHEDKAGITRAVSTRRERTSKHDSNHGLEEPHQRYPRPPPGTPKGMEAYFEKAFVANQNRRSNYAEGQSRAVSPRTSPPQSPPRTPRTERSSKDYFEPPSTATKPPQQRSRPPSWDDSHFKDIKPLTSLLGAATLGASLAGKAIPNLSRAPTSHSGATPSSGSQSGPGSGQRSRKPSPVSEGPPTVSHSMSRTESTASRDEASSTRTTTYTVHESRTLPLSASYAPVATTLEPPRPAIRAASYSHSHAPDQSRPPVLYRAHSSTSSPSSQGFHPIGQFPVHQVAASAPMTPEPAAFVNAQPRHPSLPACPRSKPVAGLQDWYTIRDMPYLDFCPTCMGFLGATRFRDYFIPSLPRDSRRPVVCAMSHPWLRVAWIQAIKQEKKDLTLVWQISTPPPQETRPCPGPKADLRRWYHLTDPRTGRPVENFDICSACVRNLDLIFPKLQFHLFDRPAHKPSQEKVCNMNTKSRHFFPIMIELERLADRREKEQLRQKDIQDFVDFIRRISRHRECSKDTMLATSSWHYIPELPELTICEECFEEVVWPLRDRPIARDVSKTLKLVPNLRRSHLVPGISCQLYSDRMRRIFYEAVNKNDFEGLKTAAKYRYSMEHRLQEMHKLYELDQRAGIDRRAEMEKNVAIWKAIE